MEVVRALLRCTRQSADHLVAHIAAVLPTLKTASAAPREHGLAPEDFAAALLLLVPKLAGLPEAKPIEAAPPEMKPADAKLPDRIEPKLPELKLPEVKPPEVKPPEVKLSDIKLPDTKLPAAKLPRAKPSETVPPDAPDAKPLAVGANTATLPRARIATSIPRRQVQNSSAPARQEPRDKPERDAPAPAAVNRIAAVPQQGRAAQVESIEPAPKAAPRMADGIAAAVRIVQVEPEASTPTAAPQSVKSPVAVKVETRANAKSQAVVIDRSAPSPEIESASTNSAPQPEAESVPEKNVAAQPPPSRDAVAAPEPAAPSAPPAAPAPAAVTQPIHSESPATTHLATKAANDPAGAPEQRADPRPPNLAALAQAIAAKSTPGTKRFEIRLDPPELGRVEVHLSVKSDGKAEATLYADRPETVALLTRDSQNLERALKDAGLDVSNSSLNFSLKGQDRQGDGGGASRAHTRSLSNAVVARSEAANASLANRSLAPSSARLDIFV